MALSVVGAGRVVKAGDPGLDADRLAAPGLTASDKLGGDINHYLTPDSL